MIITDKGGDFEQPPVGTHVARSIGFIDIGSHAGEYQGTKTFKRQFILRWELCNEFMTKGENEGQPFVVTKFYTASLSEKANLRKDLVNWRGREFTAEELAGFAVKNILDKGCMVQITTKGDKNRVTGVMQLPKGTVAAKAVNPIQYFSLEPKEFDPVQLSLMSEKMQSMIMDSPEYKACIGVVDHDASDQDFSEPPTNFDDLEEPAF